MSTDDLAPAAQGLQNHQMVEVWLWLVLSIVEESP
jgi:hypothetical protein